MAMDDHVQLRLLACGQEMLTKDDYCDPQQNDGTRNEKGGSVEG